MSFTVDIATPFRCHDRGKVQYRPTVLLISEGVMITREKAAEIAAGRGKVTKVLSIEEVSRPPHIYGLDDLKAYWITYLEWERPIQDSLVVLVSKDDGRIVYEGGAGDEG